MYAVIETGGKQYKVSEGDVIYIEKLDVDSGVLKLVGNFNEFRYTGKGTKLSFFKVRILSSKQCMDFSISAERGGSTVLCCA